MDESAAKFINYYHVLEKLGTGGMGEVFLAEDTRLGRKVALKVLPAAFSQDEERLARFQQEARAASALNHPNILTVYEIGVGESGHYIATEFIEGETLRKRLSSGKLELNLVLDIAIQVANGLVAAHEAGIMHRDIKPENIMLRRDGYAKILDFGLAKPTPGMSGSATESATCASLETTPGVVMGTVKYMSPEQARGLPLDARSDLFSLGVVLYEMVTGRVPFEGPTSTDTIATILHRDPPPLARFSPDTPLELDRILMKTLAKDRAERYQTARDFLIDLKSLKQRLEIEAEIQRTGGVMTGVGGVSLLSGSHAVAARPTEEPSAKQGITVSTGRRRKSRAAIDSLAVLPLENAGADPSTEYLSDGLTESIINHLSRLPKLRVMARSTVFRYKGKTEDPLKIGAELGVRAVLTGRVLQMGNNLVIKSELVDVSDGSQLWGENYKRKLADIFDVEEEISKEISDKLRLKLSGDEKKKLTKRFTQNPEAYQLYLKGRFHWNKRSAGELRKGIEYFEQAIGFDPSYALAYAGLADSYALLSWFYLAAFAPSDVMPKARAAASRALELDDSLAEAHASMAMVDLLYDWDFPEAEREYKRALQLNPGYATVHQWYGVLLSVMGKIDDAIIESKRALELDPLSLIINASLGWIFYFARRFDDAAAQFNKTIELAPSFYPARLILGYVYVCRGQYTEAIGELQRAQSLSETPAVLSGIGHAYAASGEARKALDMIDRLTELSQSRYISAESQAIIYIGMGDCERAFEWLKQAVEQRSSYVVFLKVDPRLDPIRSDSRFSELLLRIGLQT